MKPNLPFLLFILLFAIQAKAQRYSIVTHKITAHDQVSPTNTIDRFRWIAYDESQKDKGSFVVYRKTGNDSVFLFEAQLTDNWLNGEVKQYDEKGRLTSSTHYLADGHRNWATKPDVVAPHRDLHIKLYGKKDGKEEIMYQPLTPGGPLRVYKTQFYVKGEPNGSGTEYYRNGNIMRVTRWNMGKRDGIYIERYENAQMREKGNYASDVKEGWWYGWYEDGALQNKTKYETGHADTVYTYHPGGILATVNFDAYHYPDKASMVYDSLGRLRRYAHMNKNHTFDSVELAYYANGQMEFRANVKNGEWDGPYTGWHANGKVKVKGQFKKNCSYGKWFYYNEKGQLTKTLLGNCDTKPEPVMPEVFPPAVEEGFMFVTEFPDFPGGPSGMYNENEIKFSKDLREVKILFYCNDLGETTWKIQSPLSEKDEENVNKLLEKKFKRFRPFKAEGRGYATEIETSFRFSRL